MPNFDYASMLREWAFNWFRLRTTNCSLGVGIPDKCHRRRSNLATIALSYSHETYFRTIRIHDKAQQGAQLLPSERPEFRYDSAVHPPGLCPVSSQHRKLRQPHLFGSGVSVPCGVDIESKLSTSAENWTKGTVGESALDVESRREISGLRG